MTRTPRRWVAAAALVAAVVMLAGCDGDGGDPPTSTGTETTTGSQAPSDDPTPIETAPEAEPPEAPAEMAVDDINGAWAAAEYFLDLYDYMRASGDTGRFDAVTTDDCEWCDSAVERVADVYDGGGRIIGADLVFDITDSTAELPVEERPFYVVIIATAVDQPFQAVDGDGTVREYAEETLAPLEVGVQFVNGRFLLAAVDFEIA